MSYARQSGFTFIELLVVMLIIGVLLGVTFLRPTTSSIHKIVQNEAEQLEKLFSRVRDKALLENSEYGFSINNDGEYSWWILSEQSKEWIQLNEQPFHPRRFPDSLIAQLESSDGIKIAQPTEEGPSIVLFSDREITPFKLRIMPAGDEGKSILLLSDGFSNVEIFR